MFYACRLHVRHDFFMLVLCVLVSWLNHLHFYYVVYTAYMSILCLFDSCVFIRQSAKINHITMLLCTILEFLLIVKFNHEPSTNFFCVADRVRWKYKITLKKCGNRKFHNIMCFISWQITKIRMIKPAILLSCVLIIYLC